MTDPISACQDYDLVKEQKPASAALPDTCTQLQKPVTGRLTRLLADFAAVVLMQQVALSRKASSLPHGGQIAVPETLQQVLACESCDFMVCQPDEQQSSSMMLHLSHSGPRMSDSDESSQSHSSSDEKVNFTAYPILPCEGDKNSKISLIDQNSDSGAEPLDPQIRLKPCQLKSQNASPSQGFDEVRRALADRIYESLVCSTEITDESSQEYGKDLFQQGTQSQSLGCYNVITDFEIRPRVRSAVNLLKTRAMQEPPFAMLSALRPEPTLSSSDSDLSQQRLVESGSESEISPVSRYKIGKSSKVRPQPKEWSGLAAEPQLKLQRVQSNAVENERSTPAFNLKPVGASEEEKDMFANVRKNLLKEEEKLTRQRALTFTNNDFGFDSHFLRERAFTQIQTMNTVSTRDQTTSVPTISVTSSTLAALPTTTYQSTNLRPVVKAPLKFIKDPAVKSDQEIKVYSQTPIIESKQGGNWRLKPTAFDGSTIQRFVSYQIEPQKKTMLASYETATHLSDANSKKSLPQLNQLQFQPFSDDHNCQTVVGEKSPQGVVDHCACCPHYKSAWAVNGAASSRTRRSRVSSYPLQQERTLQVVEFNSDNDDYSIIEEPQEVWPFLETGRCQKTFETIGELGEGGCGCVSQVKHKLDNRIYALKKVKLHTKFDPDSQESILQHPAMKEIQAISKLAHKNIVGYKGCWVEADEPNIDCLKRINSKIRKQAGKIGIDPVEESDADDSEIKFAGELQSEVQKKAFEQPASDDLSDSFSYYNESQDEQQSDQEESSEYSSDCDSDGSMYQLCKSRTSFVSLTVMILMEYTDGETLRDIIDKSPAYLSRQMVFNLFTQLMTALKQIHGQGLVHRDIKPENIFVNRKTHRLQVGDFGLAKSLKVVEGATGGHECRPGSLKKVNDVYQREFSQRDLGGTPLYLSPEQKIFNSRRDLLQIPREKVDIYAAGLVLFEMCGLFKTDYERCTNIEKLQKEREFPRSFQDSFFQESKIITLMTNVVPEKRPSAAQFLDRSPEHQCWSFDLKMVGSRAGRPLTK